MGKAHVGGVTDWLSCKARGTLEVFSVWMTPFDHQHALMPYFMVMMLRLRVGSITQVSDF